MGLYGEARATIRSKGRKPMSRNSSKNSASRDSGTGESTDHNHKSPGRVLSINRRAYPRKETLESTLSTVLRTEDKDLDEILRALADLSEIAKSQKLNSVALNNALKKAAVWAVEKSMLDREIRSLAITDDLTGFFNRRGFLAAASQQLKIAHRDHLNVLLLYCDLDGLKSINDSFGHREGDLALVRTADALEETFRDSDLLARLGGDEFAVLAWEAAIPDLRTMLARLTMSLENANADEGRYKLSLSVGVARYDPNSPLALAELMACADQEMYRHKKHRASAASAGE
jgi:diguanylate cyclase (GGDEF)-like protein